MVVGHCNHFLPYDSIPVILIYGFHMPLFAFVSGIAIRMSNNHRGIRGICAYAANKANALLRPYFIACLVSVFIYFLQNNTLCEQPLKTILVGQARTLDFAFNLPLWFLTMTFVAQVIFYFVATKVGKEVYAYTLTICCFLVGLYCMRKSIGMFWNIDVALMLQIFLGAGYWGYTTVKKQIDHFNTVQTAGLMLVLGAVYVLIARYNGRIDLNARRINNLVLFLTASVLGILCVFFASKLICRWGTAGADFLAFAGRNSLAILCWHIPFSSCFYSYLVPFFPDFIRNLVWGEYGVWIGIIILLIFDIPGSILMHRFFVPRGYSG